MSEFISSRPWAHLQFLVPNIGFGVITSSTVEEGFRLVDRRFFVPKSYLRLAHSDQPIKDGNIHISAPHIYGAVMEALELPKDSSLSFLNAGSGTGYLTCIAASILGPKSSHYCIEIHGDAIEHCQQAIMNWKHESTAAQRMQQIDIIHGNALELDIQVGECALGFDRIYIGASIEVHQLPMFKQILKPGGILVGPVDGDLVKVVRLPIHGCHDQEYSEEILSPVRFAPLVAHPQIETVIPARVWTPTLHQYFPDNFQNSCRTLLLCSHSNYVQPPKPTPVENVNAAALLPRALWLEIFSYTHRDWFEAPQSEIEFLRRRLKEEQEKSERATRASLEASLRCRQAERERDMYKLLALRWRGSTRNSSSRVHVENDDAATDMPGLDDAIYSLLRGHDSSSFAGLASLFRSVRDQGINFEESVAENENQDDSDEESYSNRLEDDHEMVDDGDDDGNSESMNSGSHDTDASDLVQDLFSSSDDLVVPRQVRAVSITGMDI